jgi:cobalt transporter subunit CbtB
MSIVTALTAPDATAGTQHVAVAVADRSQRLLVALLALGIGAILLLGAGFIETAAVHNATHDGRHAAGFPCH